MHLLGIMLRVCVIGHSLIPSTIPLNVPSVQLDIIRHPGTTINFLTDKLTDINFWSRRYDGIILCIGGNDLSRLSVEEVFSRLCAWAPAHRGKKGHFPPLKSWKNILFIV